MIEGIIKKFALDYINKLIQQGLLILAAQGWITGQESQTLYAAAGILITLAINVGLNALQNKKIATMEKKVEAIPPPKPK